MLINNDIVGEELQNFKFTYEAGLDTDRGYRVYGNVNSGDFFRNAQEDIRRRYGENVYALLIFLSSDKTHADRSGNEKFWPVLVTLGNFTTSILSAPICQELVGYCPLLPLNDSRLKKHLESNHVTSDTSQKSVCRKLRLKSEQAFIHTILEPVRKCEESGPVRYQVGRGPHSREELFFPIIAGYTCKLFPPIHL